LASGGLEFGAVLLMGFGWLRRDDATTVWMEHQTDKMEKNKVTSRFTVLMVVGSRQDQLFFKEFKS
jgi:hypothetical protein